MSGPSHNHNHNHDLEQELRALEASGGELPACSSHLISCVAGQQQLFEWKAQRQDVTSRGSFNTAAAAAGTAAATPMHPLVPLLLCSERHFPQGPPFIQPAQASAHARYHADQTPRRSVQVKKPLNAFMLYMKEMRHQVLQEGNERESAAINRILGRRWHRLSGSEQAKYYDLAHKERLLHMQLYPGWSAKDNYGKRKRRRSQAAAGSCSRLKL